MKKIFAILFLSVVLFPSFVFAADSLLKPYWGPIVSCVGGAPTTAIVDGVKKEIPTCTSLCDLFSTAQNVLRLGVTIALYVMVPIYVLYGGFKIATTGISGDKIAVVRKMFFEILIGIAIILGSFTIINTFMNGLAGVMGGKNETSTWLKISCFRQKCGGATHGECPSGQECVGSGSNESPYKCEVGKAQ